MVQVFMEGRKGGIVLSALCLLAGLVILILFTPNKTDPNWALHELMVIIGLTSIALSASIFLEGTRSRAAGIILMAALLLANFLFQSEPMGYLDPQDTPPLVALDQASPYLFSSIQLISAVTLAHVLGNTLTRSAPARWRLKVSILIGSAWAMAFIILAAFYSIETSFVPGAAISLAAFWQGAAISRNAASATEGRWGHLSVNLALISTLLLPPLLMLLTKLGLSGVAT